MKDCFALRFNLHKSGCEFADDTDVFSDIFNTEADDIEACLNEYKLFLEEASRDIADKHDISLLNKILANKTIVFMGDSITSDRVSYAKIFEKMADCSIYDCAVSCSRSVNVMFSFDDYVDKYKPDIVSVMIGTNDYVCIDKEQKYPATSQCEFKRNLEIIVKKAKAANVKLIFHSIPRTYFQKFNSISEYAKADEAICEEYNDIIKNLAISENILFNDTTNIFDGMDLNTCFEPDGLHLSPLGQKLWAEKWIETLLSMDEI